MFLNHFHSYDVIACPSGTVIGAVLCFPPLFLATLPSRDDQRAL